MDVHNTILAVRESTNLAGDVTGLLFLPPQGSLDQINHSGYKVLPFGDSESQEVETYTEECGMAGAGYRVSLVLQDGTSRVFDNVQTYDAIPEPIPTIQASVSPPSLPFGGGNTTVSWLTTDATFGTGDNGVGPLTPLPQGSATVPVKTTTAFNLSVTGPGGGAQATATVNVAATPSPATLDGVAQPLGQPVNIGDSKPHVIVGQGDGSTVVQWKWSWPGASGPSASNIAGPLLNADGSLTYQEEHATGQKLTVLNVAAVYASGTKLSSTPVGSGTGGAPSGGGSSGTTGTRSVTYPAPLPRSATRPSSASALYAVVQDPADQSWFLLDPAEGQRLDDAVSVLSGRTWQTVACYESSSQIGCHFMSNGDVSQLVWRLGGDSADLINHGVSTRSYHVEIVQNGQTVKVLDVGTDTPVHTRNQEWVWRDKPLPISADAVMAAIGSGLLFRMDPNRTTKGVPAAPKPYTELGFSSMVTYEPTTGGRPEIGWVEEWIAYLLALANAGNLAQADLSWITTLADCAGSEPAHFRDFTLQQGPFDIRKYKYTTFTNGAVKQPDGTWQYVSQQGATQILLGDSSQVMSVDAQAAHMPELLMLACIATDNPLYARWAVDRAMFACSQDPPGTAGLLMQDEPRGNDWGVRECETADRARKMFSNNPACLLDAHDAPTSVGGLIRDNTIAWLQGFTSLPAESPAALFGAYSTWVPGDPLPAGSNTIATWENNGYGVPVYAWVTKGGNAKARQILVWLTKAAVKQAQEGAYASYWPIWNYAAFDVTKTYGNGWTCQKNGIVYKSLAANNVGVAPDSDPATVPNIASIWQKLDGVAPVCTTWAEVAAATNSCGGENNVTITPDGQSPTGDLDYPVKLLDALACAVQAGITDTDVPGLSAALAKMLAVIPKGAVTWSDTFAAAAG